MSTQELYEMADWEIRLNLADVALLRTALAETKGNNTLAIQVYWRLRAESIRNEASRLPEQEAQLFLQELRWRLQVAYERKRKNDAIAGRIWSTVCFSSFITMTVCSYFTLDAISRGQPSRFLWSAGFLLAAGGTVWTYAKAKQNAGQDPFT